jgi:Tfp pilus assembly protein PilF
MIGRPPPYRFVVTAGRAAPADPAAEADRLYQAGFSHMQSGRLEAAVVSFRQALGIKDDFADAHAHLAVALQGLHRTDEAVLHYERALTIRPGDAGTLNNFGNILQALNRPDDAVRQYEAALAAAPDHPLIHVNLANALHAASRHDEAQRHYDRALALDPKFVSAHMNRGNSFKERGQYDEAIACYERALALDPRSIATLMNLAKTLQMADRRADIVACYRKLLDLDSGNADARMNMGMLHLASGQLSAGWDDYEQRWFTSNAVPRRAYPQPRWNRERVRGTLLVWGEQGVGDQVLHASMIPELTGSADEIVLEVEPRLVPLFARSFPAVRVVALGPPLYSGPVQAHVPIGGIGRFLRPSLEAFPRREDGYLVANATRVSELRRRLATDGRAVVGVSWISRNAEFGKLRSASLRDFEKLLRLPGCRFVDLQYGDTESERAALERDTGIRVERLDDVDTTADIDGLAALIAACDAVVTVDNTTVHLAGALGRPTWVLAPHGPACIWYWFEGRDDSPWYPRVRVMRQGKGQSFAELMPAVTDGVSRAIGAR